MEVFVAVGSEGITGIFPSQQASPLGRPHQEARRFLTQAVSACVEGCTSDDGPWQEAGRYTRYARAAGRVFPIGGAPLARQIRLDVLSNHG